MRGMVRCSGIVGVEGWIGLGGEEGWGIRGD